MFRPIVFKSIKEIYNCNERLVRKIDGCLNNSSIITIQDDEDFKQEEYTLKQLRFIEDNYESVKYSCFSLVANMTCIVMNNIQWDILVKRISFLSNNFHLTKNRIHIPDKCQNLFKDFNSLNHVAFQTRFDYYDKSLSLEFVLVYGVLDFCCGIICINGNPVFKVTQNMIPSDFSFGLNFDVVQITKKGDGFQVIFYNSIAEVYWGIDINEDMIITRLYNIDLFSSCLDCTSQYYKNLLAKSKLTGG